MPKKNKKREMCFLEFRKTIFFEKRNPSFYTTPKKKQKKSGKRPQKNHKNKKKKNKNS